MKFVDTHCHISFNAYKDDVTEVIDRSFQAGVGMINVGTQQDTSKAAVDWADKYPSKPIWAAIGLHPTHTIAHGFNDAQELDFKPRQESFAPAYYQDLVDHSTKVVAVGECGLDYYRLPDDNAKEMKKTQYANFMPQAEFAAKNHLPLIIHCRDAYQDQRRALDEAFEQWGHIKGVMHCFTGSYEEAKLFLDLGWYLSFSGIATFAKNVQEVATKIPLKQLLIETDAPYLTPAPHRGKRNEPAMVELVAASIAKAGGVSIDEFARQTTQNAIELFHLS